MKKNGLGKRLLALLLALTIFGSLAQPGLVYAAMGDIKEGDTGLVGNLNTSDSIRWPIKIYDYLNDGMLFEYSTAQDFNAKSNPDGGYSYGGGETMPMIDNEVVGVDYTSYKGYYRTDHTTQNYAFKNWGSTAYAKKYDGNPTEVERSVVKAVKDQDPMYLHLKYVKENSTSKAHSWVSNFSKDDDQYYNKSDVRFVVVVYRTNDVYAQANSGQGHNIRAFWAVSDNAHTDEDISNCNTSLGWKSGGNATGSLHSAQEYLVPSTEWAYHIIDMKSDYINDDGSTAYYGIKTNWDSISGKRIAGVGLSLPLAGYGEEMDISHIAYFSSTAEATRFGEKAVAFNNDPGEYMGYSINDMTHTVSGSSVSTSYSISEKPVREMWNMGNNQAFTMLWASTGGGWLDENNNDVQDNEIAGGDNKWTNGYHSYMIGKYIASDPTTQNSYRTAAKNKGYVVSDTIFTLNKKSYDMSQLKLGYTLYNTLSSGVMTAGLLQSSMATFNGVDGQEYRIMNYKSDTVAYIATLLRDTLIIPERDYYGYNYNFVKGSPSVEYYEDVDGDGRLDVEEDKDNDGYLDVFEDKNMNGVLDKSEDLDGDGNLDVFEDKDFDGVIDPAEDLDGDSYIDVFEDLDKDGVLDPGEDVDHDGKLDTIEYVWNEETKSYDWVDFNGNGQIDLTEDVNGNDILDVSEDLDKDGKLDGITAAWDAVKKAWVDGAGDPMAHNVLLKLTEDADGNDALDLGEDLDKDGRLDSITAVWDDVNGVWKDSNGNVMSREELLKLTEDVDGDDRLDVAEDLNGNRKLDGRDLASSLREDLGITFASTIVSSSSAPWKGTYTADLGTYNKTLAKTKMEAKDANGNVLYTYNGLIGPYLQCKDNIETFYDAAYYLLHNLFVDNSYNQVETDYHYLVMSKGTVENGGGSGVNKDAYVFDAGFTDSDGESAIVYDKDSGTISASTGAYKHIFQWGSYDTANTTLNPFMPVNDDGEGPESEFKADGTPYFREDGASSFKLNKDTYQKRNYNYVLAANGEMIFQYSDKLFFQFQGDDDVYMFINGELVLDIGAAHSITDVRFNMNDYIDTARNVLGGLSGYEAGISDADFIQVLADNGIGTDGSRKVDGVTYSYSDLVRLHRLNLVDGRAYTVDFYYMERHGYGANMRIATNIVMVDPNMETEKNAYQGTDADGNPLKVDKGALIDDAQPIDYEFAMTNIGNTKLYKLGFQDEKIGVNLSYDGGLQTYGKPTVTQFTVESTTDMSVKGLIGAFNLDGTVYFAEPDGHLTNVTGGNMGTKVTVEPGIMHSLKLYQVNNPVHHQDLDVYVSLGGSEEYSPEPNGTTGIYMLGYGKSNKIPVAGIRVQDANGGTLGIEDLVIKVDGYASAADHANGKRIKTININLAEGLDKNDPDYQNKLQERLKAFLTNMQDPGNQTGTEEGVPAGKNFLYYGAGLWQYGTVTISGMWYSMSTEEQAAKVFDNTVYTSAYKSMEDASPLTDSATHRVFAPGEAMYYQWSGHTVYIEKDFLWDDVLADSTDASNPLFEQGKGIQILDNAGRENLVMEITDAQGKPVTVKENMYSNGVWSVYSADHDAAENERCIFYNNTNTWANVYVYYWSKANGSMVSWPGIPMHSVSGRVYGAEIPADAEFVIFNNGAGTQTADLALPEDKPNVTLDEATNDLLHVNFTATGMHMFYVKITSTAEEAAGVRAMVPVVFHVTDVEDSTYVLDYGLRSEDLNTGGRLFDKDDLLGTIASDKAELMGMTTVQPSYLGEYTADGLGNFNRIDFTKGNPIKDTDNQSDNSVYLAVTDGRYYIGDPIPDDGVRINYVGSRYSLDRRIWFQPTDFMDEAYDLWLAITVHHEGAAAPSAVGVTGPQYHVPGTKNEGTLVNKVDIGAEVQMFKKVTVLPATVVYYEDDFQGVNYNNTADGSFVHHGEGSGTLTQSVDQSQVYGQDKTYQADTNDKFSGNSMMTVNISNTNDVASFDFTGTGFEIISRTNSFDSASFVVDVLDAEGNIVKKLPIITEFTNLTSKCDHEYHNTNGYCTYCGKNVGHIYPTDELGTVLTSEDCTVCGAGAMEYYLFGNINGVDLGMDKDKEGEGYDAYKAYKFKDGKLKVTFNKDSYVVVRDSNETEYWTNGYPGNDATAALMYVNTNDDNRKGSPDKLRVPGGVEVEFTLVENGKDGIVLSYSSPDILSGEKTLYYDNSNTNWEEVYIYYWSDEVTNMVVWPGVPMEKVEGSDTVYSFVVPADAEQIIFNNGKGGFGNQTSDLLIPGNGYVYKDGVWSVYGSEITPEVSTYTMYFNNTIGWEDVFVHYDGAAGSSVWPGNQLTPVESSTSLYSVEVPIGTNMVIFNNGSGGQGNQTRDLCVYGSGYVYESAEDKWYDPDGKAVESKTVYYKNKAGWDKVYIYSWTSDTKYAGDWPGTLMNNVAGTDIWYYELPEAALNVIFNNNSGVQTGNLRMVGTTPTFNDDSDGSLALDRTVYFENTRNWDQVYVHYWNEVGDASQWPGIEMTYEGNNIYSAVIPITAQSVIFNNPADPSVTGETRVIYFKNDGNWPMVDAYYWSDSDKTVAPKQAVTMTQVADSEYWYIEIPAAAEKIVFSNGMDESAETYAKTEELILNSDASVFEFGGSWTDEIPDDLTNWVAIEMYKTADLALPTDGNDLYSDGKWYTFIDGTNREIYQVPVIRVDGLTYGKYTVKISGMPSYKPDTDWSNVTNDDIRPTYLYIDGVRIFQPMGPTNDHYLATENGAAITELRNLLLQGSAAFATWDVSTSTYTGNGYTWTENRNGELFNYNTDDLSVYEGNKLDSINDYLAVGPNNEVYLNGNLRNEAVVFYVTEEAGTSDRTVQIAARALDSGLFTSSTPSGVNATLYQGVKFTKPDGETGYGWSAIDTVTSGTEQYYTIDYSNCPVVKEENGVKTYQVSLYVRSGMVSLTSVKTKGFTIPKSDLEGVKATDLRYDENGFVVSADTNKKVTNFALDLATIGKQMDSIGMDSSIVTTPAVKPTLNPTGASLSLQSELRYNIYFSASQLEDVLDMGLLTFDSELTDGTYADASKVYTNCKFNGKSYTIQTDGVAAKAMGDDVYFKLYARLTDGTIVYSDMFHYSAVDYVKTVLGSDAYSDGLKKTCIALMNYGANAQVYFGYNTDNLMNSFMTAEQQAMVDGYDSSMVSSIVKADASKTAQFTAIAGGYSSRVPSMSLEGAFAINYYFTPSKSVDRHMTFYYWDEETYNSVDALTVDNATGSKVMNREESGSYWAAFDGIAAKELDETVYVAAVYESDGVLYSTGVLAMSVSALCANKMNARSANNVTALAQAIVVYSDYAKAYFGN